MGRLRLTRAGRARVGVLLGGAMTASGAGLKLGDYDYRIDQKPVKNHEVFSRLLAQQADGSVVVRLH